MLNEDINNYYLRNEQTLKQLLAKTDIPALLLKNAMDYVLFPGGKKLRPILVYLFGEILAVDLEVLDIIAASIEIIHTYSLVHDDLPAMDNDDYRRDRLSCHRAFDEGTAILAGDGLHSLAVELLLQELSVSSLSPSKIIEVTKILLTCSGVSGMISGQSLDLSGVVTQSIDTANFTLINHLKTGKLFHACLQMVVASANNCDLETVALLQKFINIFGLAFQVKDDYLDYIEIEEKQRRHLIYSQQLDIRRVGTNERDAGLYNNYMTGGDRVCNNAEKSNTKSINYNSSSFSPNSYSREELFLFLSKYIEQLEDILILLGDKGKNLLEFMNVLRTNPVMNNVI